MGAAVGRAKRVFRMYNIDNRVDRVLSKERPTAAPRHPIDRRHTQSSGIESNIAPSAVHQKNQKLLEHLQSVKVLSTGSNPVINRVGDTSGHPSIPPLLNRVEDSIDEKSTDAAFGYVEPQRIPPGRVSLRQFLAYLQHHRQSSQEYSVDRFSDMYTIKPEIAQNIFKYHGLLALQTISRRQSTSIARSPHDVAVEVLKTEREALKKPGPETGVTSKF